jgi:type I restriction enzyme M protein
MVGPARRPRRIQRPQKQRAERKVSAADIKAGGFNLDVKNPHNADSGPGGPDELLTVLQQIRREGQEMLAQLNLELATALSDG